MTDNIMTCERLDELLPDYLEASLDAVTRDVLESHLAQCARCAAIVGELNDVRAEARALPALTPSRDLWSGIEARISAQPGHADDERDAAASTHVISFESRRGASRRWSAGWLAAAAALLMIVSSGVTYTYATRSQSTTDLAANSSMPSPTTAGRESLTTIAPALAAPSTAVATAPIETRQTSNGSTRLVRADHSRSEAENSTYDAEIASLRRVVRNRESRLDPATVRELRRNLDIIDNAIAQSRAALQRDPASGFLNERLNNVLGKKVELLRTAALLPART